MSGTARRLAEAANEIINPQPVAEAKQIDEISKATKDAYVAKRGSQLSSMLSGHLRGKQLTGPQQANAVTGIKRATGKKEEVEVEEDWKSLKKTKADLDAIRKSGKRVTLRHGEGDTLYRVSNPKKVKKEEVEASETELTLSEFLSQLSEQEIATIHNMMNETLDEGIKKKLAAALLAAGIGLGGSAASASTTVPTQMATQMATQVAKSKPTPVVKAAKATPGAASPEAWKAMQRNKEIKRKIAIGALGLGAMATGLGAIAASARGK